MMMKCSAGAPRNLRIRPSLLDGQALAISIGGWTGPWKEAGSANRIKRVGVGSSTLHELSSVTVRFAVESLLATSDRVW